MQKSFDGIVKKKPNQGILGGTKILVRVDHARIRENNYSVSRFQRVYYPKLPIFLTVLLMLSAFGAGMWYNMATNVSNADTPPPAGDNYIIPITATPQDLTDITSIPDNVLFNLPLGQLEHYLDQVNQKQQQARQDQILASRAAALKDYLSEKDSPLVQFADVIAQQPHWKLILAISYAESTLGKHCYTNNCSGIGVSPGHPLWRQYATLGEWVVDFNSLLDRRYKDWTLEEMDGVYVQPRSTTWLFAARQILTELQQRGIE